MKKSIPVHVLQAFDYAGQSYQPGQNAWIPIVDALGLAKKKLITVTRKKATTPPAPPVPEPEPVVETPKRRTYKRRDLQAEQTTEIQAEQTHRWDAPSHTTSITIPESES